MTVAGMDCFNYSCPFRVNQSSAINNCECSACLNRCNWPFSITSNRTLTDAELAEMQRLEEGAGNGLIEREAAIETIMSEPPDAHYPEWYADKINSIPAVDVATVRHGRWDSSGKYRFQIDNSVAVRCTECGCSLTEPEYIRCVWNYCPVCGAKMDGGSDG